MKAAGWLELPSALTGDQNKVLKYGDGTARNYSCCYNTDYYAPLWTAYPLAYSHTQGSGHTSSWRWNPYLEYSQQVNVKDHGYEVNYGDGTYARGHMCPNADRKSDDAQNEQTFYLTNQLPQIQNGFNGGIWSSLENAVRNLAQSTDTVYVAVGPVYRKVGGSETIKHLTASEGINPSTLDIPNYFYKVLLKVKRNGPYITSASAIGFWFEHKVYESGSSYTSYAVSVDQIESWTGIDFFSNLPDKLESTAETNTSWSAFSSF